MCIPTMYTVQLCKYNINVLWYIYIHKTLEVWGLVCVCVCVYAVISNHYACKLFSYCFREKKIMLNNI